MFLVSCFVINNVIELFHFYLIVLLFINIM